MTLFCYMARGNEGIENPDSDLYICVSNFYFANMSICTIFLDSTYIH